VPEAPFHDDAAHRLKLVLEAWAAKQSRPMRVLRNLAIRWLEDRPKIGIDPDVCILAPPPPHLDDISSLCLWKSGHVPPPICFEIVSREHPHKDYTDVQDRYAALGTHELVVFDPMLAGPPAFGGPVHLQLWRRDSHGDFERVHFGDTPVHSEVLGAWLLCETRHLDIATDKHGTQRWLTEAESARAEARRSKADAKRAETAIEQAKADAERAEAAIEQARADVERAKADAERARAAIERVKVEAERAKADAERERLEREALARRLAELEAKIGR
jgi:hypothetical protein